MFLSFDGVEYDVTEFSLDEKEISGELKRTLSGQLRGKKFWEARRWSAGIICFTDAAADALYAASDDGYADVAMSGNAVGGASVTARVTVSSDEYVMHDLAWVRKLSVDIREQIA